MVFLSLSEGAWREGPLASARLKWEDNIKKYLLEICWGRRLSLL